MNICIIVMVMILFRFLCYTINRFMVKDPIHPSVLVALDTGIVVGALLWLLTAIHVIRLA